MTRPEGAGLELGCIWAMASTEIVIGLHHQTLASSRDSIGINIGPLVELKKLF